MSDRRAAGLEKGRKANRTNDGLNRDNGNVNWRSQGRKMSRKNSSVLFCATSKPSPLGGGGAVEEAGKVLASEVGGQTNPTSAGASALLPLASRHDALTLPHAVTASSILGNSDPCSTAL